MLFHDRSMHGVTSRHLPVPHDNFFGALRGSQINGQYLIGDATQSAQGRLNSIAAIYSGIPMQYLLKNLGIGDQALSVGDETFEQSLSVGLAGMRRANEIHGDI
jgi:hypothetical protein